MISGAIFHKGVYLNDAQIHDEINKCLFCGRNSFKEQGYLQRNPDIKLLKCTYCNATTASRVPKDEVLFNYYQLYYNEASGDSKVTFDNTGKFAEHILRYAHLDTVEKITILDYGGGDGSLSKNIARKLLSQGKAKSVHIDNVELSPVEITSEDQHITVRKLSKLSTTEGVQYDLVIASAIIEHLPDPTSDFYNLFELVSPNGYFYARTPFMMPFFKLFKQLGLKFDLTYPAHIHDLGDSFWNHTPSLVKNKLNKNFEIVRSAPSIVETQFKSHPLRTFLSHLFKAPWHLFKGYKFVGGWEIFLRNTGNSDSDSDRSVK